jgi:CheY-like chemotaxis protein
MALRVLLVEDNELVTDAMRVLLEAFGHEVHTAGTVAGGVTCCVTERPDVVLLDLTLPDGHGLQLLARIRDAGGTPPMTVALTGHDDPATLARCNAAGCRATLLKPVPTRDLIAQLATWEIEIANERAGADARCGSSAPRE